MRIQRLILYLALLLIGGAPVALNMVTVPQAVKAAQPTTQPSQAPSEPAGPVKQAITGTQPPAPLACLVTAEALNVRNCPGIDCAVIGWLQAGQVVNVTRLAPNGWAQLNINGWVNSSFINCEVTK